MSTKKVYEQRKTTIYERKDGSPLIGSGAKDYKADGKEIGAEATGKTVGVARHNLEPGKGGKK